MHSNDGLNLRTVVVELIGSLQQAVGQILHISIRGLHLANHVLDVASLLIPLELLLHLLVLGLQVGLAHLHLVVVDGGVGESNHGHVLQGVATFEGHLG